jgi:hypothetical protein
MALANVWDLFNFSSAPPEDFVRLARCTVSTSLLVDYFHGNAGSAEFRRVEISPHCRAIFSLQLGNALARAERNARNMMPNNSLSADPRTEILYDQQTLERMSELLDALGEKIGTEYEPGDGEIYLEGSTKGYRDWEELKTHFLTEIDDLEQY